MSTIPESINLTPRRMNFSFKKKFPKRYWAQDNPLITTFFIAMSAVFPEGERSFIRSVRNFQDQITDPVLQNQMRAFAGQEAHHGAAHEEFNQLLEKAYGYPMQQVNDRVKFAVGQLHKRAPKKTVLAHTIALEHFTAILANQTLLNTEAIEVALPEFKDMIVWHAIEETEHKAVAFDVYKAINGGYFRRIMVMLTVTFAFFFNILFLQIRLLIHDRTMPTWKHIKDATNFFWGNKPGGLRKIIPEYFDYFKPSFHPWEQDNSNLIKNWETSEFNNIAKSIISRNPTTDDLNEGNLAT